VRKIVPDSTSYQDSEDNFHPKYSSIGFLSIQGGLNVPTLIVSLALMGNKNSVAAAGRVYLDSLRNIDNSSSVVQL
jgi:hypothetical protein